MKNILALVLLTFSIFGFTQDKILTLVKTPASDFVIDGTLSEKELLNASQIDLVFEHLPGYNTEPSYKTVGFVNYSQEFVYIAFTPKVISFCIFVKSILLSEGPFPIFKHF